MDGHGWPWALGARTPFGRYCFSSSCVYALLTWVFPGGGAGLLADHPTTRQVAQIYMIPAAGEARSDPQ